MDYTTLEWTPKPGRSGPVPSTRIAAADIQRFIAGEQRRCNVTFFTQKTPAA